MATSQVVFLKLGVFLILVVQCGASKEYPGNGTQPPLAPAVIIFGDSTVDPGNNNKVFTLIKSDFPPYGRDFYGQKPTGRFCNGKIVTDYIVSSLGIKELLPAYLDPELKSEDLITGVSFASSGTGYDNVTAKILSVIPLWKQMEYFTQYQNQLIELVGKAAASYILSEAIYGISMGSNDFVNNYFINPIRMAQYTVEEYEDFLVEIATEFIRWIYSMGARKLAVIGVPPLGCLPSVITIRGGHSEGCVNEYNEASMGFNQKLIAAVDSLSTELVGLKMAYGDIYSILYDIIEFPQKYGFVEVRDGCCGTGLLEVAVLCNRASPFTCTDATKYVFWDSFHPTQSVYKIIATILLEENLSKLL
eukprot:PITA_01563